MPIPKSVAHYLKQAHHMSPEELVEALSQLVQTDNLNKLPTLTTDALKLQLDADDANADLFYSPDVAASVHHLTRTICLQIN